ncbi:MAG: prenyltransferase [Coriobacteriales bacterium]|nr:prenyltransferase [Coriobacteriales bacterium]
MSDTKYKKLTFLSMVRLAAPHTWPAASILPCVFGLLYSAYVGFKVSPFLFILLLISSVFSQCAVNTLNDYADYKKGADKITDNLDPTDAVLLYESPNPKHVLNLGVVFCCTSLLTGCCAALIAHSAMPFLIGIIAAFAIVFYSFGKTPLSYLPLGEIVSGVVMGALIPIAVICVFASYSQNFSFVSDIIFLSSLFNDKAIQLSWLSSNWFYGAGYLDWVNIFISVVPFVFGIGLINFTQNICDLEKDTESGRKTLPVLVGRKNACIIFKICLVLWIAIALHVSFWHFGEGFWAAVVCTIFGIGSIRQLFISKFLQKDRQVLMQSIIKSNLFINSAICFSIIASFIF